MRTIVAAGALLAASSTMAGAKWYSPVAIYRNSSTGGLGVYGSVGSTRNSANTGEYLGCMSGAGTMAGGYIWMLCWARDAAGQSVLCTSRDPRLIQVALGAGKDSYLAFETDAAGSTCSFVETRADSHFEPSR